MISHISLGSADLDASRRFYAAFLAPLGLSERQVHDDDGPPMLCWYRPGTSAPRLFVSTPYDGARPTAGNGTMIAFTAPSRAAVDAAHAGGMAAGGTDEGAPGLRPNYDQEYYGAYLRDPDGNKLHVVHRGLPVPD